jgi:hypothetical protein
MLPQKLLVKNILPEIVRSIEPIGDIETIFRLFHSQGKGSENSFWLIGWGYAKIGS